MSAEAIKSMKLYWQVERIENELDLLEFYPVVALGLSYRF